MPDIEEDRLDEATWFEQLGRLAEGLAQCDIGPERHIRRAYHLQRLAPKSFGPKIPPPAEEHTFEALLEAGAYEEAVQRLVGTTCSRVSSEKSQNAPSINASNRAGPVAERLHEPCQARSMLQSWAASFLQPCPAMQ